MLVSSEAYYSAEMFDEFVSERLKGRKRRKRRLKNFFVVVVCLIAQHSLSFSFSLSATLSLSHPLPS